MGWDVGKFVIPYEASVVPQPSYLEVIRIALLSVDLLSGPDKAFSIANFFSDGVSTTAIPFTLSSLR